MAARFMTHVTCRLTAKNRDQLQNPTLGNRVWATYTFLHVCPQVKRATPDFTPIHKATPHIA